MDQHTAETNRPAHIAAGLLARKGEARPSLARGFEAAEYALAYPLIARGAAGALAPRIAHHAPPAADDPRIARIAAPSPATLLAPSPAASASGRARKAAFTLRLDADRHARLRDACTATRRSAQGLVTEALDAFLADMRRHGAPLSLGS